MPTQPPRPTPGTGGANTSITAQRLTPPTQLNRDLITPLKGTGPKVFDYVSASSEILFAIFVAFGFHENAHQGILDTAHQGPLDSPLIYPARVSDAFIIGKREEGCFGER